MLLSVKDFTKAFDLMDRNKCMVMVIHSQEALEFYWLIYEICNFLYR